MKLQSILHNKVNFKLHQNTCRRTKWLLLVPGLDQRRIAIEAAKGTDLWRTLQEGGEEKDQEKSVSLLDIPIWNFFWGVMCFSQKLEYVDDIWMKDGSEEEPMIGFSPIYYYYYYHYHLFVEHREGKAREIRESRNKRLILLHWYMLLCNPMTWPHSFTFDCAKGVFGISA